MILMMVMSFMAGLILPTGGQRALRLASAIAWWLRPCSRLPIGVHVLASTLNRSTWRQKQNKTQPVKEFCTIPHLSCFSYCRSHQWQPLAGSSEQLWDQTAPWERFTLHWTARFIHCTRMMLMVIVCMIVLQWFQQLWQILIFIIAAILSLRANNDNDSCNDNDD